MKASLLRLSALAKFEMLSANLAIGAASAFVLATAAAGLAVDRDPPLTTPPQSGWTLRGSLSATDMRDRRVVETTGPALRGRARLTRL